MVENLKERFYYIVKFTILWKLNIMNFDDWQ